MAALAVATLLVFLMQGSHGIFKKETKIKKCKDSDWAHMNKSKSVFPCKIHNDTREEMYLVKPRRETKIKHGDICLVPHRLRNTEEGKTLYRKARQCPREAVEHVVGKPNIDKDEGLGGKCSSNQCKTKCIKGKDLTKRIEQIKFPGRGAEKKAELVKQVKDNFTYQGDNKICWCKPGKTGINCKKGCQQGNYGQFCMFPCSDDCKDPSACNTKTGTCVCKDGYYFEDGECLKDDRECNTKRCKPKHGRCVDVSLQQKTSKCDCLQKRTGKWCESSCSDVLSEGRPMYGLTCDRTCGHCTKQPCDLVSGKCPRKKGGRRCLPGYAVGEMLRCDVNTTNDHYWQRATFDLKTFDKEWENSLSEQEKEQMSEKIKQEKLLQAELDEMCQYIDPNSRWQMFCLFCGLYWQEYLIDVAKRRSSELMVKRKLLQASPDGSNAGLGDPLEELKVVVNMTVYFAEENSLDIRSLVDQFSNSYKSKVIPGLSVDKSSIRIGEIQKPLKSRPGRGGEERRATWIFVMVAIVGSVLILAVVLFLVLKCRKQRKPGVQVRQNTRAYPHYPVAACQLSAYRSFEISQL